MTLYYYYYYFSIWTASAQKKIFQSNKTHRLVSIFRSTKVGMNSCRESALCILSRVASYSPSHLHLEKNGVIAAFFEALHQPSVDESFTEFAVRGLAHCSNTDKVTKIQENKIIVLKWEFSCCPFCVFFFLQKRKWFFFILSTPAPAVSPFARSTLLCDCGEPFMTT